MLNAWCSSNCDQCKREGNISKNKRRRGGKHGNDVSRNSELVKSYIGDPIVENEAMTCNRTTTVNGRFEWKELQVQQSWRT